MTYTSSSCTLAILSGSYLYSLSPIYDSCIIGCPGKWRELLLASDSQPQKHFPIHYREVWKIDDPLGRPFCIESQNSCTWPQQRPEWAMMMVQFSCCPGLTHVSWSEPSSTYRVHCITTFSFLQSCCISLWKLSVPSQNILTLAHHPFCSIRLCWCCNWSLSIGYDTITWICNVYCHWWTPYY